MCNTRRMLLGLWLCFCSSVLYAQVTVEVIVNGVEAKLEENIRLFLSIEQQKEHPLMSEGRLRRLHTKADQEIANALHPFGFYRVKIGKQLERIDAERWQAVYDITPGPAITIGAVDFRMTEPMSRDEAFQPLLDSTPLIEDQVFNHVDYEEFKSSLARLASERGYFDARFSEHRVEIDLDQYEVRVQLYYDGGVRYHFGAVSLQQNALDAELLQRYIPFEQGDPYTLLDLIELQQALHDSDYFRTVEVSPGVPQKETGEIPINVVLTPRRRHRYSFGVGYGTDTGARTRFNWEIPRLNEHGHRFSTEARVSEIGYSLNARYRIPVFNPRTDQLVYSAGVINEETDTNESTLQTIGVSLNRSRGEWRESLSLNYQQEDFEVADDFGDSKLLMPGIHYSRTWGNNFIIAVDGLRFDIGLRGARENLASDTDFWQLQGGLKGISSINANNRIIARGRLGHIGTDQFNLLPSSVRFFAGGGSSVRGYEYESLGPQNADGEVVGGRYLMEGSLEFEHSFGNKWGVALFYDAGNAMNSLHENLERGAGFGLRWKSPVGPVRIDLASAISQDGNPWRLHINIGPDL